MTDPAEARAREYIATNEPQTSTAEPDIINGILLVAVEDIPRWWRRTHPDHAWTDEEALSSYIAVNWGQRVVWPCPSHAGYRAGLEAAAFGRAAQPGRSVEGFRTMPAPERACYIFDLDGTLADLTHRLHHIQKEPKDWRSFFAEVGDDAPISHALHLARTIDRAHRVVIVSGRSDECRGATEEWLADFGLRGVPLYMRKAGDHRPDDVVKSEILDQMVEDRWLPIMAFDDRDRVVAMWRARGVPCAQVAPGDF